MSTYSLLACLFPVKDTFLDIVSVTSFNMKCIIASYSQTALTSDLSTKVTKNCIIFKLTENHYLLQKSEYLSHLTITP